MGELKNDPMWSESRVKLARSCLRAYWFNYYLSWGGWDAKASQERRTAYTLKKMTSLPMWTGSIVHDVIQHILNYRKASGGKAIMPIAKAEQEAIQALRRGWIESTQKRWQTNSKAVNLQEHYYEAGIDQKKCDETKLKVLRCIRALYDSDIFKAINAADPEKGWLTLEEFQSFELNTGERVSVKIDFGFRRDGKVWLLDWKTGKPSEAVIDQLVTYAMYALKMGWAKRLGDIVIVPVYLDIGEKDKMTPELSVSMPQMERQANTIRAEFPILRDLHMQSGDRERFPVTDDARQCRFCNFRGICSGANTEIPDDATPFK